MVISNIFTWHVASDKVQCPLDDGLLMPPKILGALLHLQFLQILVCQHQERSRVILQATSGKNVCPRVDPAKLGELLQTKRSPLGVRNLDPHTRVSLFLGDDFFQLGQGFGACPSFNDISCCWVWSM